MRQTKKVGKVLLTMFLCISIFLLNGCAHSKEAVAALAQGEHTEQESDLISEESAEIPGEGQAGDGASEAPSEENIGKGESGTSGEGEAGENSSEAFSEKDSKEGSSETPTEGESQESASEDNENDDAITLEHQEENFTHLATVHLVAAGDDLLHETVINGGLKEDGTYDYSCFFSNLLDVFENADIAAINQETIMGGAEKGYSGYPRFNSPDAIAEAIYKAGFDVVLQANNHTLDMGISGLTHAISVWKQYPSITLLGVNETKEQYERIQTVTRNGITIAMLSYTYGFNGNILPSKDYYMANTLNRDKMKEDIKKAKELSDFVIVFPHWGTEYVYEPDSSEKSLAQFFADQGVDLVIGGHPHVLQTAEWLTGENGNQTFVYYSLGNYISSMNYTDRMLGGLADVVIAKDGEKTYLESVHIIPIVTHYERGVESNFGVYRLSDYTEEMAKKHYIYGTSRGSDFSVSKMWELTNQIVGEWVE
ncbi:MAG: CapA family protein [Lachnospiraceae bacterium]|nr:CapA family protein [Lachnospiraceae bacterium]